MIFNKDNLKIPLVLGDGYTTSLHVHCRGECKGAVPVVYLHGIQSHPGWFSGSSAYLAENGCCVFGVTRRGSGDNDRDRGHAASAKQLLRDTDLACRFALEQTGAEKVHIMGVSWGGKLAAVYATWLQRSVDLASVTMIAPGIAPRVSVGIKTKLGIAATLLVRPRQYFDIPLNDVDMFTDNQAMREYLRNDKLRLVRATGRFLYTSRRLDRMLARAASGSLKTPATLILARRDRIIDNEATLKIVNRLTQGCAKVEWFDAAHTIEFEKFEKNPQPFFSALARAVS